MKKTVLFAIGLMLSSVVTAQVETAKIAASTGGTFGASGNYVKLYTANPDLSTIVAADSALGDFSNAVLQDGALIYCHVGRSAGHPEGSDQIMVYNAATGDREFDVNTGVSGLQDMAVFEDYLVLIRGFGAADNKAVTVLNKNTNLEVFADTQIAQPGAMFVNDGMLYVANTQNDEAVITVYDLTDIAPQKVGEIAVNDTLASGVNGMFVHDGYAYLIHRKFNPDFSLAYDGFTAVNLADSSFNVDTTVSVNEIFAVNDGKLWLRKNGISTFDLASGTFANVTGSTGTAAVFDSINGNLYLQNTDFFSYGDLSKFDNNFDTVATAQTNWSGSALTAVYNHLPVVDSVEFTETSLDLIYDFDLTDSDRGDTAYITNAQLLVGHYTLSFDESSVTLEGAFGGFPEDTLVVTICDGLGGCITHSVEIEEAINSVEELTQTNYKIYPNPATDVVFVDGLNQNTEFRIIDLSGKEVKRGFTQNRIEVSDLNRGMYLLQMDGGNPQKILIK